MGKYAYIGMFAAIAMAGVAWSAPATEAFIAETQAALDRGDAQHAAKLAASALEEEGVSAGQRGRLLLYRGLAEELLGSHESAMRDFAAALGTRALPVAEQQQALLQRGFLRDGLGRLDEAVEDYTAAINLKGDSLATALNNRANIYRRQNRFTEAQRDYLAALSAGGQKPQYSWYGLGQIAEAQEDSVKARSFYARAVAADPGYVLASERLEALGGPPDGAIADPLDPIVLHPPAVPSTVKTATEATEEADGTIALRAPESAGTNDLSPIILHPPRREAHQKIGQASNASLGRRAAGDPVVLRPALDQPGRIASSGVAKQGNVEVQLGAWRSEGEASAGWQTASSRASGVLNGLSPHIVTVDLPGRGRYYRLRIHVAAGQSAAAFCAHLDSKGVACLPVRD